MVCFSRGIALERQYEVRMHTLYSPLHWRLGGGGGQNFQNLWGSVLQPAHDIIDIYLVSINVYLPRTIGLV